MRWDRWPDVQRAQLGSQLIVANLAYYFSLLDALLIDRFCLFRAYPAYFATYFTAYFMSSRPSLKSKRLIIRAYSAYSHLFLLIRA